MTFCVILTCKFQICCRIYSGANTVARIWLQSWYQKKHQLLKNPNFGSSGQVIFCPSYVKLGHFTYHIAFYKEIKVELDCLLRLEIILAQSCCPIRQTSNFGHFRGAGYPGSELPSLIGFYQFVDLPGGYLWSKNQVGHRTVTWCIFVLTEHCNLQLSHWPKFWHLPRWPHQI